VGTSRLVSAVVPDAVQGWDRNRRLMGLGVLLGAIVAMAFLIRWATAPTYVTLYRELPLEEIGGITDQLARAGVRYRLENGGTEVRVPEADVARARVLLAQAGLPSSGQPGLELFDRPSWGMTDFTQRVTYRRALEGELARTIRQLKGVEDARVHLALPESSPLRRMQQPAQAAVVLKLKRGQTLRPETVQGITYLVANSVEQLTPSRVAVLDDAGRLFSQPGDDSLPVAQSLRQLELQQAIERSLAQKVETLLASAVGPGQARVQVAVELDFDRIERTSESFDPDGQVLQSEQRVEAPPGVSLDEGESSRVLMTNTYQNTRRVESLVRAVGTIRQLSVAVLLNQKAMERRTASGEPAVSLSAIEALVRDAVGADSTRGDRITVRTIPFEAPPADGNLVQGLEPGDSAPGGNGMGLIAQFGRPVLALVGLGLTFLLARRALAPNRAGGLSAGSVGSPAALPGPAIAAVGAPEPEDEAVQLKRQVLSDSAERPETAAKVLRAWIAES